MIFTTPQYSREKVNAAAKDLIAFSLDVSPTSWSKYHAYSAALPIINNWRSSHSYPLNTFAVTLRAYARKVDNAPLIAQRIKRLSSIEAKLKRFPRMKLSQMQDIGGCRSVVSTVQGVRALVNLYGASNIKHEPASYDDYIENPPPSGYRGVHLVYRYVSDKKKKTYNGLKIEIQLRSQYQHAWATAVETVGTFVHQALKSSAGEPEWLRFFSLMGTAIANRERTARVPDTPANRAELVAELKHYADKLNVATRMQAFGMALRTLTSEQSELELAHYYLLVLDPSANQLMVSGFDSNQLEVASQRYLEAEKEIAENPGRDAVLVSVDSLNALQRAYPNYFADTRMFVQLLNQALSGQERKAVVSPPPAKLG